MTSQDVILGMLMNKSLSGYDIKQAFESLFSYFFDASFGTIYPTLAKMEKEGLIVKRNVQQEGRPNKNVYTITDKGKESFRSYLNSDLQDDVYRSDFMVRLFFGEWADPEAVIGWLEAESVKTEAMMERLRSDYERYGPKMSPTQDICLKIGLVYHEKHLEVLNQGLERLRASLQQ